MIDLDRTLDLKNLEDLKFLENIQSNILRHHRRSHAKHILLRFNEDRGDQVRKWIAEFANRDEFTSALKDHRQEEERNEGDERGPFAILAISKTGYDVLHIPREKQPNEGWETFEKGMKEPRKYRQINDPPVGDWDKFYRNPVHAILLLADDEEERLDQRRKYLIEELAPLGVDSLVETGRKLENDDDRAIEPFGFVDGISQPLFIEQDIAKEVSRNQWEPSAPLSLVLTTDHASAEGYGSFLVFRKLEQNVRGFHAKAIELANLRGIHWTDVAAETVGRKMDGTPLASENENDFLFGGEVPEAICPFSAHIRKVNPRGDLGGRGYPDGSAVPLDVERSYRIARRGMPFLDGLAKNPSDRPLDEMPETGVGLLFMSFQSHLSTFETMQEMCDHEHFAFRDVGIDPIAGRPSEGDEPSNELWNFVTLKGGEYFYAPSLSFLRDIENLGSDSPQMPAV